MHAKWTRIKNNTTQNKNSEKKGTTYSVLTMKIHVWIRKCQDPAKSAPSIGFLTVLTTILVADLDYVIMSSSCKVKKKMVTPISVKQISSQIILTPYTASYSAYSCNLRLRLSSIETERRYEDISMHVTGSQWNCLKLTTWFGSVAADISVLPLRKKIYLTNKLIFNMLVSEHLWILAVSGLGLLSVIFSGILNRC